MSELLRPVMRGSRVANFGPILGSNDKWVFLAIVAKHDGDDTHWEVTDDGNILVTVKLMPLEIEETCRLGALAGGPSSGVWAIPDEGTEVVVVVEDGGEGDAYIVGVLDSQGTPAGLEPGKVIIVGAQVLIHDGNGGEAELPTMAEFRNHTHTSGMGPTGPVIDPISGVGDITGTTILKAK